MSHDQSQFMDLLQQYHDASHYSLGQLSRLTGIPKSTIANWLQGRVKQPRVSGDLLKLAAALRLDKSETDRLLQSVDYPSFNKIIQLEEKGEDDNLVSHWIEEVQSQERHTPFQAIPDIPYFIGRHQEQKLLKKTLLANRPNKICSLHGMAGAGKTTLAARLAYQLRSHFPDGVLWAKVDATDTMSILSAFAYAYDRNVDSYPDPDSRSQIVRDILSRKQTLIILDNVQHSKELEYLLPPSGSCAVIITTRNNSLAATRGFHRFHINEFSKESGDALALFKQILGKSYSEEKVQAFNEIADTLGHLPLAIAIVAGRLAYEPGWVAEDFLAKLWLEKERLNQLVYDNQNVRLSFDLTYSELSPAQQAFFVGLSVFAGEDFSAEAVAAIMQCEKVEAQDILRLLYSLSLIRQSRGNRYYLHPLLKSFAQEKLQDSQFEEAMIGYFIEYAVTNRVDTNAMRQEQDNIEHALKLANNRGDTADFIRGVHAYYRYLHATGAFVTAEAYLRQAQQAAELNDDRHKLAISLHYLGQVREKQGDLVQAEVYCEKALQLAQEENVAETIGGIMVNLGVLSAKQGKSDQAEMYWQQALEYARQYDKHENVSAILSNLGALASIRGDYEQAKHYYEQGLETANQWGHEHRMSHLLINLGSLLQKQGDTEQARALYEKALALSRQQNRVHAITVTLQHLGEIAQDKGDYQQAKSYYNESLTLTRKSHLRNRMSQVLACLGEVTWLEGELEKGETYLLEGLILARSIEGNINNINYILYKWGRLKLELGQTEAAQEAFAESLSLARQAGLQELIGLSLYGLSGVALASGKIVSAQQKGYQSLEILKRIGHMKAIEVRAWLADLENAKKQKLSL